MRYEGRFRVLKQGKERHKRDEMGGHLGCCTVERGLIHVEEPPRVVSAGRVRFAQPASYER